MMKHIFLRFNSHSGTHLYGLALTIKALHITVFLRLDIVRNYQGGTIVHLK